MARDWNAFTAHWNKILGDEAVITKAVLLDGHVAGNVVSFLNSAGEREVRNIASLRVLEKCGFTISGEESRDEVEEFTLELTA